MPAFSYCIYCSIKSEEMQVKSLRAAKCECPALFIPKVAGHSVSVEPKLINLTNLMTLCTENVTEFPKRRTKALGYEIDNVQNMHSDECVKPKIPSPVRD